MRDRVQNIERKDTGFLSGQTEGCDLLLTRKTIRTGSVRGREVEAGRQVKKSEGGIFRMRVQEGTPQESSGRTDYTPLLPPSWRCCSSGGHPHRDTTELMEL